MSNNKERRDVDCIVGTKRSPVVHKMDTEFIILTRFNLIKLSKRNVLKRFENMHDYLLEQEDYNRLVLLQRALNRYHSLKTVEEKKNAQWL